MDWTLTPKTTPQTTLEATLEATADPSHQGLGSQNPNLQSLAPIVLHPQFFWIDEFDWQALVVSEPIYTITGAMIIETGIKSAGRPITLNGDNVWLKKSLLDRLFLLAQTPTPLSLGVPDGRVFDVLLKKIDKATPITAYQKADETGDDYWRCDMLFITV